MKAIIAVLTIAALSLSTGCSTVKQVDANKMANTFYQQARTYESLAIRGANTITFTGTGVSFIVQNEMQPLSVIPRDPGVADKMMSAAERTTKFVAGAYFGEKMIKGLSKDRDPVVVDRQPQQVVRPTVID